MRRQKAHKTEKNYFGKENISILYFQEVNINNSEFKNIFKIIHSVTCQRYVNSCKCGTLYQFLLEFYQRTSVH